MRVDLLDYPLPDESVAQRPTAERDGARLLVVEPTTIEHRSIRDWVSLVPQGALVVVNDTQVRRARLDAYKETGGRVELLMLTCLSRSDRAEVWSALGTSSRPLRSGTRLTAGGLQLTVVERRVGGEMLLEVVGPEAVEVVLARQGRVPLPPYIRRRDDVQDAGRYQTVFAQHIGSAAAPTAGLHLTSAMLEALEAQGNAIGRVTLHVGAGTFLPVRTDDLSAHEMHAEGFEVSAKLARQVTCAREQGRAVVAVGTTVVRALESAADRSHPGHVTEKQGDTRLLIQPGYHFSVVDALLTNFHAPRSTLLALVAAFIGQSRWREAYRVALADKYRFLSYGDAMWLPQREADAAAVCSEGGSR